MFYFLKNEAKCEQNWHLRPYQMTNMYAPGGKFNNAEIFLFPLSSEGIETVRSVFELMSLL